MIPVWVVIEEQKYDVIQPTSVHVFSTEGKAKHYYKLLVKQYKNDGEKLDKWKSKENKEEGFFSDLSETGVYLMQKVLND